MVYRTLAKVPLVHTHALLLALLEAREFDRAYELTTDEYRATHTLDEFRSDFNGFEEDFEDPLNAPVSFHGFNSAEVFAYQSHGFMYSGPTFVYRLGWRGWQFTGIYHFYFD